MAGPLERGGQWHEFLSRYNILVVYKPRKDTVVADGLSRWAYPAGEADDTSLHGSDADLEGVPGGRPRRKRGNWNNSVTWFQPALICLYRPSGYSLRRINSICRVLRQRYFFLCFVCGSVAPAEPWGLAEHHFFPLS